MNAIEKTTEKAVICQHIPEVSATNFGDGDSSFASISQRYVPSNFRGDDLICSSARGKHGYLKKTLVWKQKFKTLNILKNKGIHIIGGLATKGFTLNTFQTNKIP